MPKDKESSAAFLRRVIKKYPMEFRCDKTVLFCLMCDSNVAAQQMFQVKQHRDTKKHKKAIERKQSGTSSGSQTLLTTIGETADKNRNASEFVLDLSKCFLKANIALHKVSNPAVVEFIEKHTKYAAPSETILRSKYLPTLYNECIEKMKQIAAGNYIWVSVDESTDAEQRFVINFVFGVLNVERERSRSYLFASKVLDATNSSTVAEFLDESVTQLSKQFGNSWLKLLCEFNSN